MAGIGDVIKRALQHPLTAGLDLDDPATTHLRRQIVASKPFLRRIYLEWYRQIRASLPPGDGALLELGSGAGFLREVLPDAVTSEIFHCPGVHLVLDGQRLPFHDASLRAVVMTDVMHHLPDVRRFLRDASRAVRPGGAIVAVEPWVTSWSRIVYGKLHHEPFRPESETWEFPASGPLSGANGALPWMLCERDRGILEREFPQWRVAQVKPLMPVSYLLSGGVSLRSLVPGWSFGAVRGAERLLQPWMGRLAMFAHLVLERTAAPAAAFDGA